MAVSHTTTAPTPAAYTPPAEAPGGPEAPAGANSTAGTATPDETGGTSTPPPLATPADGFSRAGGTPSAGSGGYASSALPTLSTIDDNTSGPIDSSQLDAAQTAAQINDQTTKFAGLSAQLNAQNAVRSQVAAKLTTLQGQQQTLQAQYDAADPSTQATLQPALDKINSAVLGTEATLNHVGSTIDALQNQQDQVQQFATQLFNNLVDQASKKDPNSDDPTAPPAPGAANGPTGGGTGTLGVNGAPLPLAALTVAMQARAAGLELTGGASSSSDAIGGAGGGGMEGQT